MKKKAIALLSVLVISAITIGGAALANNVNADEGIQPFYNRIANENRKESNFNGHCNLSRDAINNMAKVMNDNGFEDAARYMEMGDREKMHRFMSDLSEEEYQKMIEIMQENGYKSMCRMLDSAGRENMVKKHNSMGPMHSRGSGMMRR